MFIVYCGITHSGVRFTLTVNTKDGKWHAHQKDWSYCPAVEVEYAAAKTWLRSARQNGKLIIGILPGLAEVEVTRRNS